MPSAKEPTYLIGVSPDTTPDFLARDVDRLVSQIKENLCLSNLKTKSNFRYAVRQSPYPIVRPTDRQFSRANWRVHERRDRSSNNNGDDSYELLQQLLRKRKLIQEAVKKLKANIDVLDNSEEETDDDDERTGFYRRKPYFYDSEDEPLPPVFDLEL